MKSIWRCKISLYPPTLVKQIEKLIGTNLPDIRIPVKDGSFTQELLFADGPSIINDPENIQKWMMEFTYALDLPKKDRLRIQKIISKVYKLVNVKSVITVPMRSADNLIGLMDFSRSEPFSEEDTKRVAGVVGQVTAAITGLQAEKEMARSRNLLLSLSQAAPLVQQADSADGIFQAIGEKLFEMSYAVTVLTLQDNKKNLAVGYYTDSDMVRKVEKMTGISSLNYSFPIKPGGYFDNILTGGKVVFSHFEVEPFKETLPKSIQPLAGKLMVLFGKKQSIIAPLVIDGQMYGLLSISGSDLKESDMPAIATFANQAAIALEKTRLFHEY